MSNIVRKKNTRTIIICIVLSVLLLAGSAYVIVDHLVHKGRPCDTFTDEGKGFLEAYAASIEKSVRELTQEDIDKIQYLAFSVPIENQQDQSSVSITYRVVIGYEDAANAVARGETPSADSIKTISGSNVFLTDASDINKFKNLRVLRFFDENTVYEMNTACYTSQYMAYYYQLSGLSYTGVSFDNLISVVAFSGLKNLGQLSELTSLEELSLQYTGLKTLKGIENFKSLKTLDISHTNISDISALAGCTGLETLNITDLAGEQDTTLDEASAENTDAGDDENEEETKTGITELDAIKGLVNLKKLVISGNAVADISGLSGLTALEYFSATDNYISDISVIKNMKSLKELSLAMNKVTDLSAVNGCEKLEKLYAYENEITALGDFSKLKALDTVAVYDNKLTDISTLENCTKLTAISAYNNEITTLGNLGKLTELATIDIYENKLESLEALAGCEKLTAVNAYKNDITTLGDFSKLKELVTLNIYENHISDLSTLNGLTKLETINAYSNDLAGELDLTGCTALTTLSIYHSKVEHDHKDDEKEEDHVEDEYTGNLEKLVIKGLENLTSVDAYGQKLTAIPDLTDCKALATLNLSDNKITDISAMKDNTVVTTLDLSENEITDIADLGELKNLKTLNVSDNKIESLDSFGEKLSTSSTLKLTLSGNPITAEKVDEFKKKFTGVAVTFEENTDDDKADDTTEDNTDETSGDASDERSESEESKADNE